MIRRLVAMALLGVMACSGPHQVVSAGSPVVHSLAPAPTPDGHLTMIRTRSTDPYELLGTSLAATRRIGYVLAPPPERAWVSVGREEAARILVRDFPSGPGAPQVTKEFLVEVETLVEFGIPEPPTGEYVLAWAFVIPAPVLNTFQSLIEPQTRGRWTVIFIDAASGRDGGGFIG